MNNETAANKMQEPELLSEVPPILKRLAKTVAYAFYEPELIVTISLLTKYPCIDEDTLIEKLQFDKRQMRQALSRLKNDKLVKQRVIKEKQPDTGNFNIYNFYFINYKIFVNVVKYKLDHIRRKLETEEQQVRNRPSFQCQDCDSHYSDLEVDRLIDFATGDLKCTFCSGVVEEDPTQINSLGTGSSLGKFNEQMETIFNLLKECEHINLAPEVLEPTPSTDGLKQSGHKTPHTGTKGGWSTDKKSIDLYDQRIQINVGDEVEKNNVAAAPKELPAWITKSTVFEESALDSIQNPSVTQTLPLNSDETNQVSRDIMSDLLAHESEKKKSNMDTEMVDESSINEGEKYTSDFDSNQIPTSSEGVTEVADMADSDEEEDEDESEHSIKVGDVTYTIAEINDEIIEKMTKEEHKNYLEVYNDMCDQFY